jgi:hypothetical protein
MLSRAGRILEQQASHDTPVESVTFGRCRWRLPHWVAPIDRLSLPITIMAQRHVFKRDGPMPPTDQPERSKQDDKRGEHA